MLLTKIDQKGAGDGTVLTGRGRSEGCREGVNRSLELGCASNSWVEVAPVLFWADNLNVFNHSDWRRCGSIPAGPGVASEGPVPPIGESRRFSPRHHFRELPQVRQEQLCMCS